MAASAPRVPVLPRSKEADRLRAPMVQILNRGCKRKEFDGGPSAKVLRGQSMVRGKSQSSESAGDSEGQCSSSESATRFSEVSALADEAKRDEEAEAMKPVQSNPWEFVEVFCGLGRLTRAMCRVGFKAIGIDWKGNRDRPVAPCTWLDLTTKVGQDEFWARLGSGRVKHVHFAPPCGTASMARNISRYEKDGTPAPIDPKPLRSEEHPDGLPGLTGMSAVRVQQANQLYKFTAEAVPRLRKLLISWSIENPASSLMWETSWFSALWELKARAGAGAFSNSISFQSCMHGGSRDKRSKMEVCAIVDFSPLALECDKQHEHKPWRRTQEAGLCVATADERNYAELLCARMAKQIAVAHGLWCNVMEEY